MRSHQSGQRCIPIRRDLPHFLHKPVIQRQRYIHDSPIIRDLLPIIRELRGAYKSLLPPRSPAIFFSLPNSRRRLSRDPGPAARLERPLRFHFLSASFLLFHSPLQLSTSDFQLPCKMKFQRGHAISHVRRQSPRRTRRDRPTPSHPPQRLRASLRLRHSRRAYLLRLALDRPRRNHRQAAPQHRSRHFLQRPPHRLPARPFRIRPGKCQPPIRLVLPPRSSLLQFRAAKPALRSPGSRASLHPKPVPVLQRRPSRHLRTIHRPRLEHLPRALHTPRQRRPRHSRRHLAHRPHVPPQAPSKNRARRRKARHRNRALRSPRRCLHHYGPHHLRHRPSSPLAHERRERHPQRISRHHRRNGFASPRHRPAIF